MKKHLHKIGSNVLKVLDGITYFVPDMFLGLAISSLFYDFGKYDSLFSLLLFVSYIAVSYGERLYSRHRAIQENIVKATTKAFKEIEDQINEKFKERVTFDGLLVFADAIDNAIDEKLKKAFDTELKGEDIDEVVAKEEL